MTRSRGVSPPLAQVRGLNRGAAAIRRRPWRPAARRARALAPPPPSRSRAAWYCMTIGFAGRSSGCRGRPSAASASHDHVLGRTESANPAKCNPAKSRMLRREPRVLRRRRALGRLLRRKPESDNSSPRAPLNVLREVRGCRRSAPRYGRGRDGSRSRRRRRSDRQARSVGQAGAGGRNQSISLFSRERRRGPPCPRACARCRVP